MIGIKEIDNRLSLQQNNIPNKKIPFCITHDIGLPKTKDANEVKFVIIITKRISYILLVISNSLSFFSFQLPNSHCK